MPQFYLKYNDSLPTIRSNLSDANGYIDLSSASNVKFVYQQRARIAPPVTGSASILGASSGYVQFSWNTGSLPSGGFYNAEWRVNFSNGTVLSIPNDSTMTFFVSKNIF